MKNVPLSGEWATSFDAPVPDPDKPAAAPPPKRKLNVVLPFCADADAAAALLRQSANLSGQQANALFLMPFKRLKCPELVRIAEAAFIEVRFIHDSEGVTSDWQRDGQVRDAAGPNSMFRQAAWFFYVNPQLGPWLYLEPDCVPLTPDWLEQLETEYRNCGKPFMGVKMMGPSGQEYLNGVGIYPPKAAQLAASLVTRTTWPPPNDSMEVAFDMAASREVLPKAHITQKIQLSLNGRDEPRAGVVLYHGPNAHEISRRHVAQGEPANGGAVGSMPPETPARNSETNLSAVPALAEPNAGVGEQSPKAAIVVEARESEQSGKPNHDAEAERDSRGGGQTILAELTLGDRIRLHVNALAGIASEHSSGRKRILDQLRKRRLTPKAKK